MTGGADDNGGRVTTREFYDALLRQNTIMMETERRIISRLDVITNSLPKLENQVATNKNEISLLRARSNMNDIVVAVAAGIASAIAAVIGSKQ